MVLGFIGTGKITTALVEGFSTCRTPPEKIIISPRNTRRARDLSERFNSVKIGQNNQEVTDQSDTVFLALRPETAESVLTPLNFRRDHTIISLIPTIPLKRVSGYVAPAEHISRAVPLPSVAGQYGPILLYKKSERSESVLRLVGKPVPMEEENALHALWTMNGMISPLFELMAVLRDWSVTLGVDPKLAQTYTAGFIYTLAKMAMENPSADFSDLAQEAATPGGLNEQAVRMIQALGGYESFETALDAVHERFGQ